MSVFDFVEMCIERGLFMVELYHLEKGVSVWSGSADEIPDEYLDMEVCSFDPPGNDSMTLNIDNFNI